MEVGDTECTGTMMTAVSIKRNLSSSFELSETVVSISVDCRAGCCSRVQGGVVECKVV